MEERECTIPQLGSGPTVHNAGSGFYTKDDYREILTYANDRHICVTPQINMPGHARAAIKAMEARSVYSCQNTILYVVDILLQRTGPVFTIILRIFLGITLKSKKNSLLRIFLFLE